jgi:hypothetical protein
MKAKTLRFKDTKEYVHIENFGGEPMVCTGALPNLQPMTATIELMKKVCEAEDTEDLFDFDNMELVELDVFESGEVGADIRNKLSPPLNLVEMLEVYFDTKVAHATDERQKLVELIKKEMKQSKVSIKYLAKLL